MTDNDDLPFIVSGDVIAHRYMVSEPGKPVRRTHVVHASDEDSARYKFCNYWEDRGTAYTWYTTDNIQVNEPIY
jgi:hypothetical protein